MHKTQALFNQLETSSNSTIAISYTQLTASAQCCQIINRPVTVLLSMVIFSTRQSKVFLESSRPTKMQLLMLKWLDPLTSLLFLTMWRAIVNKSLWRCHNLTNSTLFFWSWLMELSQNCRTNRSITNIKNRRCYHRHAIDSWLDSYGIGTTFVYYYRRCWQCWLW